MTTVFIGSKFSTTGSDGTPLAGGKVYTYAAGTLTPLATYTDYGGASPNANPMILDANGRASIWLGNAAYRFIIKDADDVLAPDGDVDNIVPGEPGLGSNALRTQLADPTSAANGDALVAVKRTFTGAGATNEHAWHEAQVIDLVADLLADTTGAVDCTTLFQSGITAGNLRVGPGAYTMSGNVSIPANRKIIVEKGATITNTGGRFTAYDVDNVHWQIDGVVKSIAMATAAAKVGWPSIATAPLSGYFGDERGFIEFGGASSTVPRGGFTVTGSGVVSGDWTGTAGAATSSDVNFKGIGTWNCKNVLIENVECFGFIGEAIYFFGISANCTNVIFRTIYSHDHKFNALNFNAIGPSNGLLIENCLTLNCYSGNEMSVGEARGNTHVSPLLNGIWTGAGGGTGPVKIIGNTVKNAGALSYLVSFSSGTGPVVVEGNLSVSPAQGSYQLTKCTSFSCKDNTSIGHAQTTNAYAFAYVQSQVGVIDGNTTLTPGGHSLGARFVDTATAPICSDLTLGIEYTTTNSVAAPVYAYSDPTSFTPTPVALTVVPGTGGAFYAGTYTTVGKLVFWEIQITPTGTCTTAATVSTTSFTGLPFTATQTATCQAATLAIAQLQNGAVSGTTVFPPTWAATNSQVTLSGWYQRA